ncbi:MAG: hypothetical protein ACOYOF_02570 [Verrucomicrobiaceae bacterium]
MNQRSHRYWIPISTIALALAGFGYIQSRPELENNFRSWLISATVLLASLLLILWFLLFSRFSGRAR